MNVWKPWINRFSAAATSAAVCLPFLISCSFSSSTRSGFVEVRNSPPDAALEKISEDPLVYSMKKSENGPDKIFLTFMHECPVAGKRTLEEKTRELFIGLENLEILRQAGTETAGSNVLETEAQASVEQRNLHLAVLSLNRKECVHDLLIWSFDDFSSGDRTFLDMLDKTALTEVLLNNVPRP